MIDSAEVASDLPLDLIGTAFQRRVWRALRDIPRGATASYAEIARAASAHRTQCARSGPRAGRTRSRSRCRATGSCAQDGSLGGYRWGLERKRALLARERTTDAS